MRKTIITIIILIGCIACDDRSDALNDLNDPPTISLQPEMGGEETKNMEDSVKFSKPEFAFSPFFITTYDPNQNIRSVTYRALIGRGSIYFKNELMKDTIAMPTSIESAVTKVLVKFVPQQVGITNVLFIVEDRVGRKDSAHLKITAFNNLEPVAMLNVNSLEIVDPYEYSFDASASFDQDAKFGGIITRYLFTINSEKIETIQPSIKYIFPAPGTYTVRLRVRDNDDALSSEVTKQITVQ